MAVTRIDLDESKRPDIRADVRQIPVPDGAFDVVHSRHVLEHFGRAEVVALLQEWVRILRVGGELRVNVPNARAAMEWLLRMDDGLCDPDPYPSWQLYGEQTDERDFHKNWFTPRRLRLLLEMPALGLERIEVETVADGRNIQATAVKAVSPTRYALTPEWDKIAEREGIAVPGLAPKPAAEEPIEAMPGAAFTTRDAVARVSERMRRAESAERAAADTPSPAGADGPPQPDPAPATAPAVLEAST